MPLSPPLSTRMAQAERQLADHHRRLEVIEQRIAAGDQRFSDYDYELDMLTRVALRNARRLDRLQEAADPSLRKSSETFNHKQEE